MVNERYTMSDLSHDGNFLTTVKNKYLKKPEKKMWGVSEGVRRQTILIERRNPFYTDPEKYPISDKYDIVKEEEFMDPYETTFDITEKHFWILGFPILVYTDIRTVKYIDKN